MKDERFSGLLITRNLDKRKRDSYNDVLRFLLNFVGREIRKASQMALRETFQL